MTTGIKIPTLGLTAWINFYHERACSLFEISDFVTHVPPVKDNCSVGFPCLGTATVLQSVIGIPDGQRGTTHLVDPARVASTILFFFSFLVFTNLPMDSNRVPEGEVGKHEIVGFSARARGLTFRGSIPGAE